MYEDVVTVFNRRVENGGIRWYPTVIEGVQLSEQFAAGKAGYGRGRDSRAAVLIPYIRLDGAPTVAGKIVLPPKLWQRTDEPGLYVTFAAGEDFDLFLAGDWQSTEPVEDGAFPEGFYAHMANRRDDVYAVTEVCRYNALPHYEVTGR